MMTIQASSYEGQGGSLQVDMFPDNCPLCHTSVQPKFISAIASGFNPTERLQIAFQCTKLQCRQMFIGSYTRSQGTSMLYLRYIAPVSPKKIQFSEAITSVSPTFIEIYNQAVAAEDMGLNQLTGIGLRKALEFLVKDFAASQKPSDKEIIEKTQLAQCISNYIDDKRIRQCATLATWLGNDETHYIRKWQDKDIDDLKVLIKLTVNWIDNVILTEKYVQDMKPKAQ